MIDTINRFAVLLFREDGEIGFCDQAQIILPEIMKPIVEKVKIKDVLFRNAASYELLDNLAATTHSNADGGLAADCFNLESTRNTSFKISLLKVQNLWILSFPASFEPGNNFYQLRVKLVIIITSLDGG